MKKGGGRIIKEEWRGREEGGRKSNDVEGG